MHDDGWRERRWHFEAFRCIDSSCIDIDDIDGTDTDIDVDIDIGLTGHHPSSKVVGKVIFIAAGKNAISR